MPNRPAPLDEKGFSLIEVMVALVVLTAGAVAVAASINAAMAAGTHASHQSRATALAVEKLEFLKAQPASAVDDEPAQQIDGTGAPDANGHYSRSVIVRDQSEGAAANTKEVIVRVEFESGLSGTKSVELFTIMFVNTS